MKNKFLYLKKLLNYRTHVICLRIKNSFYGRKFGYLDPLCEISRKANVFGGKNIRIGRGTKVYKNSSLQCADPDNKKSISGTISIGENGYILPFAYIISYGGNIEIGNNFSLHPYSMIYGNGGVKIGNNVRIAAHSVIISANHSFVNREMPIFEQSLSKLGVEIKNDVWIGAGCYVLDGVVIEEGCVIGAGSVVTKSTTPFGVYVGNPARRIKTRG